MAGQRTAISAAKSAIRSRVVEPLQRRLASWRMRHSIKAFRSGKSLDANAIQRFRRAWGNEAFSADEAYISELVMRAGTCTGPLLECGSGLTTLVAALIGERNHFDVWSLEQDPEWTEAVGATLRLHGITNVRLLYAPLKRYGDFVWYDLTDVELPSHFDLVLCDGPAVFEHWGAEYSQWRYGLLPVLAMKDVVADEILLDDATEPRAANLLERWAAQYAMSGDILRSPTGDCAIVRPAQNGVRAPDTP